MNTAFTICSICQSQVYSLSFRQHILKCLYPNCGDRIIQSLYLEYQQKSVQNYDENLMGEVQYFSYQLAGKLKERENFQECSFNPLHRIEIGFIEIHERNCSERVNFWFSSCGKWVKNNMIDFHLSICTNCAQRSNKIKVQLDKSKLKDITNYQLSTQSFNRTNQIEFKEINESQIREKNLKDTQELKKKIQEMIQDSSNCLKTQNNEIKELNNYDNHLPQSQFDVFIIEDNRKQLHTLSSQSSSQHVQPKSYKFEESCYQQQNQANKIIKLPRNRKDKNSNDIGKENSKNSVQSFINYNNFGTIYY